MQRPLLPSAGARSAAIALAALLALAHPTAVAAAFQVEPASAAARPGIQEANSSPVVARGGSFELRRDELVPLLIDRFGLSPEARSLLRLLISAKVLPDVGRERGVRVEDEAVTRRWRELDQEIKASGSEGGLEAELVISGLEPGEFREYLRLQLLQEELTRRALELSEGVRVTPDQQEIWLAETLAKRGFESPPPPWTDGVVARCGGHAVTSAEFGLELFDKLDAGDVRETCWHLLLLHGLERRMPDLSAEARAKAITTEMERRRRTAESMAAREGQGVTFEDLLRARGTSYAALARDPSVAIAALSRLWVDRTEGAEGLRKAYERERDYYDGLHGVALNVHAVFYVAGKFKNELTNRTFEEAEEALSKLKPSFTDLDGFVAYAAKYSEDPGTRAQGGDLGWVARGDKRMPEAIRATAFRFFDGLPEDADGIPGGGQAVGPVRMESGVALLWLSGIRPAPGWSEMAERVHEELRKRLIEDVLPAQAVEMVVR